MSIHISNNSVSVVARSYALAAIDGEIPVIVWLELAPHHPKVIGAIWASLVNGTKEILNLRDDEQEQTYSARGLARRYIRQTADAPRLAGRARPKFMRLVAPEMVKFESASLGKKPFYVSEWRWCNAQGQAHQMDAATTLAAMLEQGTPYPMHIGWGPYLLAEAMSREYALPLITGGPAPQGYLIKQDTPWGEIISSGIQRGLITLEGECLSPVAIPISIQTLSQVISA